MYKIHQHYHTAANYIYYLKSKGQDLLGSILHHHNYHYILQSIS